MKVQAIVAVEDDSELITPDKAPYANEINVATQAKQYQHCQKWPTLKQVLEIA